MTARMVLVVEDEPLIWMLAVEMLEDAGWTVIEFETADQAAAFWKSADQDVAAVFTDINMPGNLDGLDLAALVTRTRPSAVVVVTSGRYREPPADIAGKVRFLPKPWGRADLVSALRPDRQPPLSPMT